MENSNWQRRLLQSRRALNQPTVNIIQNPIGIAGGAVSNALNSITTGGILENTPAEGITLGAGTLKYSRYWRYRLLLKADNGMEKSGYNPRPEGLGILGLSSLERGSLHDLDNIHTTVPESLSPNERVAADRDKIYARRSSYSSSKEFIPSGRDYTLNKFKALEGILKGPRNEIFIINESVSPYISLKLQNRPESLEVNPHGTWAAIQSMGRNNPFMMYTGGEDTVSFEISWYASDPDHREEVITKCKLLESWCKANGYMASPPVLQIKWGSSGIFDNCFFILESAPYKLTHFQDRARKKDKENPFNLGYEVMDLRLYPNCATQQLTFKRVSMTNTIYEDIVSESSLRETQGISFD